MLYCFRWGRAGLEDTGVLRFGPGRGSALGGWRRWLPMPRPSPLSPHRLSLALPAAAKYRGEEALEGVAEAAQAQRQKKRRE